MNRQAALNEVLPASLLSSARKVAARAERYVRSRQSYNGGFCFYRCAGVDEPNLHDTYHAVAALSLLHEKVPRAEELAQFLAGFPAAGVHQLYYCAFALELLGRSSLIAAPQLASIRSLEVVPRTEDRTASSGWLEATLRAARLKRRFAELSACPELVAFIGGLEAEGGYGGKPNIIDTYLCLSILALLGRRPPAENSARFVDRLQVPSFGFSLTADSMTASLDVIQAGMKCCAMLGIPVRYAPDVLSFTLVCQTSNGGFSRSPAALPAIEQTHRALQIISMLVSLSAA